MKKVTKSKTKSKITPKRTKSATPISEIDLLSDINSKLSKILSVLGLMISTDLGKTAVILRAAKWEWDEISALLDVSVKTVQNAYYSCTPGSKRYRHHDKKTTH